MKRQRRCTFFIGLEQAGALGRPGGARRKGHETTRVVRGAAHRRPFCIALPTYDWLAFDLAPLRPCATELTRINADATPAP